MNKTTIMYIFIFLALALLFLTHFILYNYLTRFFPLENIVLKRILISVFVVMPLLFLLAMVLMHSSSSVWTRALYFITGIWHGALLNFLVVIIFSWFIIGVMKFVGIRYDENTLLVMGIVGVVVATLVSVYGVYNVFNLKVKQVSLNIKNIPEAWLGKKVVQLSDVHLGNIFRDSYMQKILKEIDVIKPDIILITGDLLDSIDGNVEYFHESLKKVHAPQGVYFVTGNHETYLGLDKMRAIINETNIKILDNELVEIDGVQILGVSYPEQLGSHTLLSDIDNMIGYDSAKTNILLFHEPIMVDSVKERGINLMLSGHTHKGQQWPINYITDSVYNSYDYGLYSDGDFNLYVSSGAGLWGPTMRTSGHSEIVVFSFE